MAARGTRRENHEGALRAGRCPYAASGPRSAGVCYRLYSKENFEERPLYSLEEIYRTDLSEVVLRMAELGIRDFESFDFLSTPGREGIHGAVDAPCSRHGAVRVVTTAHAARLSPSPGGSHASESAARSWPVR